MTEFFPPLVRSHSQDGAGKGSSHSTGLPEEEGDDTRSMRGHSNLTVSAVQKPVHRPRPLPTALPNPDLGYAQLTDHTLRKATDAITGEFRKPQLHCCIPHHKLDTTLKDMLFLLQSSIHSDMLTMVHHFKTKIHNFHDSICQIESKMGDFASHFNELMDDHSKREEDVEWIKAKVADLEDGSRRNSIKI